MGRRSFFCVCPQGFSSLPRQGFSPLKPRGLLLSSAESRQRLATWVFATAGSASTCLPQIPYVAFNGVRRVAAESRAGINSWPERPAEALWLLWRDKVTCLRGIARKGGRFQRQRPAQPHVHKQNLRFF
ncbi:hypothetical protein SAMN05421740_108165 [Parapedobacter koreensis]|uniref:Uncharacterized protein n=1 Tax=Parapedobacter koreensis TaxID=332977 RepID=A0A1H7SA50_9SPHI|nr:hypothetical protein SAMN05421740_108165 [Parapedobacter koreensis]